MSRFYIKQIAVSGQNVDFSSVEFTDGVNIVYGPSNTGKSYMIKCIDFMFGGRTIPFTTAETGYDTVTMRMESDDGQSIQMERKIVEGDSEEKPSNIVSAASDVNGIKSGDYKVSDNSYSDLLLKLMGIEERTQIIVDKNYTANSFTIRTVFHLFYLDENHIIKENTPLDTPSYNKINASLMGLLFLLTGKNYLDIIPELTKDEVEKRAMQRAGVVFFLDQKIKELSERRGALEQSIAADYDVDIEGKLDETLSEIENVEKEITDASSESREILKEVYDISARLEEARFLRDRYASLQSQYSSDVKRLEFIIDGETKATDYVPLTKCPFCDNDIQNHSSRTSYISVATAEAEKIKSQQEDLRDASSDIDEEIQVLEAEISDLNKRNDVITQRISSQLKPQAAKLREQLNEYKRLVEARREIDNLDYMTTEFNTEAYKREGEEDEKPKEFKAKELFDKDLWKIISDRFEVMVKACAYPNCTTARMSIETADAVVNGKKKKNEGKGYRAFLNTVVLFNLMKVLEENATYTLRILVVDSPILSLKEKKENYELKESEKATPGMKEPLFKYILENCGANQMIIAENELPENVDYSNANLIEFTMDTENGRYGFLRSHKDLEAE